MKMSYSLGFLSASMPLVRTALEHFVFSRNSRGDAADELARNFL